MFRNTIRTIPGALGPVLLAAAIGSAGCDTGYGELTNEAACTPGIGEPAGDTAESTPPTSTCDGGHCTVKVITDEDCGGDCGAPKRVVAGKTHTCALTRGGAVKCWGNNAAGQLGDGGARSSQSVPVDVVDLSSGAVDLAAGASHTCALTSSGEVACWGNNTAGKLGNGGNCPESIPVRVVGLSKAAKAVAAGYAHTCALTDDGGVQCWGWNLYGQLGNGSSTNQTAPTQVEGLSSGVVAIAAGYVHTCALTDAGGVKCWGSDSHGQLGNGERLDTQAPEDVEGLTSGVVAIAAGASHTCALTTNGGIKCWGWDRYGQLGNGYDDGGINQATPEDVTGLSSGVVAIAAGAEHTCAVTGDGGVKCWGRNQHGELGDGGSDSNQAKPADVYGLSSGVVAIAAGDSHTCALTSDGEVMCWGSDIDGQLGNGVETTNTHQSKPVGVVNLGSPAVQPDN